MKKVFSPFLQQTHSEMILNFNWTCRRCLCTWWCLTFAVESMLYTKKKKHENLKSHHQSECEVADFLSFFDALKIIRIRMNSFCWREKVIWRLEVVKDTHVLRRKIIDRTYRIAWGVMFYAHTPEINSRKLNWLYEPIIMLAFDVPEWVSSKKSKLNAQK